MNITSVSGSPGKYKADFVPTRPGIYNFRIYGTMRNADNSTLNVDLEYSCGPGAYGCVLDIADYQFPDVLPDIKTVYSTALEAKTAADNALKSKASDATTMTVFALTQLLVVVLALLF
eukprot:TRINITY_DN411_c0_g1_i1.p1 TRINITY_DN411_c0_g1~~TRINITY_DN411_c0_g1_i1.p1  ORF type:complete len:118 (+),score=27.94 TRINITY_DN411_c0_g1_i1:399-752(+)